MFLFSDLKSRRKCVACHFGIERANRTILVSLWRRFAAVFDGDESFGDEGSRLGLIPLAPSQTSR
jgi:hypothetical protein